MLAATVKGHAHVVANLADYQMQMFSLSTKPATMVLSPQKAISVLGAFAEHTSSKNFVTATKQEKGHTRKVWPFSEQESVLFSY